MVEHLQVDTTVPPTKPSWYRPALVVLVVAALVLGAIVGYLVGRAGGPSAAMNATIDDWTAAVLAQNTARIAALYSDDAVWHDEALDETFTGARVGWAIFGSVEEVVDVELEAASGDTAVLRWAFEGTTDWYLEGLSVLNFDGGVIVAETVYYDCARSPVANRCANSR